MLEVKQSIALYGDFIFSSASGQSNGALRQKYPER